MLPNCSFQLDCKIMLIIIIIIIVFVFDILSFLPNIFVLKYSLYIYIYIYITVFLIIIAVQSVTLHWAGSFRLLTVFLFIFGLWDVFSFLWRMFNREPQIKSWTFFQHLFSSFEVKHCRGHEGCTEGTASFRWSVNIWDHYNIAGEKNAWVTLIT